MIGVALPGAATASCSTATLRAGRGRGVATRFGEERFRVSDSRPTLWRAATKARQLVFKENWTTQGRHTIKIVVLGTSGHPEVDLDAFLTHHYQ